LKLTPVWRAKAEAKCKFFALTLLHKKILKTLEAESDTQNQGFFGGVSFMYSSQLARSCTESTLSRLKTVKTAMQLQNR
jgi:hypothetical protein